MKTWAVVCAIVVGVLLLAGCRPVTAPGGDALAAATPGAAEAASTEAAPAEAASTEAASTEAAATVALTEGAVAFVRDGVLYLQNFTSGGVMALDDCTQTGCQILYPTWSPDGSLLLYYRGSWDSSAAQELRIANRSGVVQTLAQGVGQLRPAAWSPAGDKVIYLVGTDRTVEQSSGALKQVMEVWTQDIAADGTPSNGVKAGEVGYSVGCGGAGRSAAALVYEQEGGFAYGYLAAIAVWAPNDLLLFSSDCASRQVGRFAIQEGRELDSYPGDVRSLVLSPDGTRWAAINVDNQIVLGAPDAVDYSALPSAAQPELVFWGPVSGRLYYTSLEVTGTADEMEKMPADVNLPQWFDFTKPALHVFDPTLTSEQVLYAGDDYAYARVTEAADGAVVFSAVQSNQALYDAIEQGILTAENQASYAPGVDVLLLEPGTSEPAVLLENAAEFSLARQ